MQNVLRAPRVGTIKKISVKPGSSVTGDEILMEFYKEGEEPKKK